MKKLVLLVSVFLLVAGMVAADVTFAPAVTGSTSLTWGMDFKTVGDEMNSGFDTASSTSLDLGVTVDPFDAKSGEGYPYGEVSISGLSVLANSGVAFNTTEAGAVIVATPAIDAKLWFSEALYAFIDTDGIMSDYAAPLTKMASFAAGSDIKGTWYDDGKTKVKADYGNAGAGFTFMAGDLTATLSFVSEDKWGTGDTKIEVKIEDHDNGAGDGIKKNGIVTIGGGSELEAITDAAFGTGNTSVAYGDYTYVLEYTEVTVDGIQMAKVPVDGGKVQFLKYKTADQKDATLVTMIDTGNSVNSSLYTAGLDVAYTLTDVGTFKAYVAPTHESATKMFNIFNFGVEAAIALASFDMVGLTVGADFVLDNSKTVASEKFEYEVAVTVPVKVGDLLAANLKAAWTDANDTAADNTPLDLYADATLTAAGATVSGAYMVTNFAEGDAMAQMYKVSCSYPVAVGAGTVTPMVAWEQNMGKPEAAFDAQKAVLTASVAASIIDNVTFTAKLVTGDLFVPAGDKVDAGEFTFVTAFAY